MTKHPPGGTSVPPATCRNIRTLGSERPESHDLTPGTCPACDLGRNDCAPVIKQPIPPGPGLEAMLADLARYERTLRELAARPVDLGLLGRLSREEEATYRGAADAYKGAAELLRVFIDHDHRPAFDAARARVGVTS